jgi:SAM-dependent methyltransferase
LKNHIDSIYSELLLKAEKGELIDFSFYKKAFEKHIKSKFDNSKRSTIINIISRLAPIDQSMKILDYGSGGGQTVIYLRLLGYNVYGVCLSPKERGNIIAQGLGLGNDIFESYNGKNLPYKDQTFDLVYSEQVLEHVLDIESYYSESSRVLKKNGSSFFMFPTRLTPYDTHSRTWIIHYFPRIIRDMLFKLFGRNPEYMNKILNFKSLKEHKNVSLKYYSSFQNQNYLRLLDNANNNLSFYKGNRKIRKTMNGLLKLPLLKYLIAKCLSMVASADILLKK